MGKQQDAMKQPRRRGRPPGSSHKKVSAQDQTVIRQQATIVDMEASTETVLPISSDEHMAYAAREETLSPFSRLLRHILHQNRTEITRVARELEVSENTVYRWINGISEPRSIHLKRLPDILAEHRGNLTIAINQSFHGVLGAMSTGVQEVHKDIYRRVLELVMTIIDDDARYWQVTQAIFEDALLHLDAERRGLAITYANVMSPHEDGIHALRESAMRGNNPWPFTLESRAYLGSTTLAGTAANRQQLQTWDTADSATRLQFALDEFEQSACAYPVMRANRIAGVLIVSSTQSGFFHDPIACQAVIEYAQLLALALREHDFYPLSLLSLRPMPDLAWQRNEITRTFVKRIIQSVRTYALSRQEAELRVIREMEIEFEDIDHMLAKQQQNRVEWSQA